MRKITIYLILVLCAIIITAAFLYKFKNIPGTNPEVEDKQMELKIVTGELDNVAVGYNKTKKLIVNEYLHDCYLIKDSEKKNSCFELYYLNNFPELRAMKENCLDDKCMDDYYYTMAQYSSSFCDEIVNTDTKSACGGIT